ncbi:hypothetical protein J6590_095260, partial [Homalodisca vitripennis]
KRPNFRDGTIQTEIEELPQHLMSLSDGSFRTVSKNALKTLYKHLIVHLFLG